MGTVGAASNGTVDPAGAAAPAGAANLVPGPDGIWVARSREQQIAYPEEGNLNCLALEADSFWFEHRNRCIQTVVGNFPPPGKLFDVGGGNGYVALGLQQAGFQVALVEPGQQGVQYARQRGVETLICSTLEEAGFPAESLPAVGLFDVLEHIAEDEAFLRGVNRMLVPGGRIYLTVPAFQWLWSADDDYAQHYRRYSLGWLRKLLARSGLRVEFASYIFLLLPLPIFLLRAVPTRLGLRKHESWERYRQEHHAQPGVVGWALDEFMGWELARLRKGRAVPVGGSCLVVARKEQ